MHSKTEHKDKENIFIWISCKAFLSLMVSKVLKCLQKMLVLSLISIADN